MTPWSAVPAPAPVPLLQLWSVFPALARWAPCPWILASGFASGGNQTETLSSLFPPWGLRSLVSAKFLGTAFQAPPSSGNRIPHRPEPLPSLHGSCLPGPFLPPQLSAQGWVTKGLERIWIWVAKAFCWPHLNLDANVFLSFLSYLFLKRKDY